MGLLLVKTDVLYLVFLVYFSVFSVAFSSCNFNVLVSVKRTVIIGSVFFFRDVQEYGLSRSTCLSESDHCDAVLCALVIDLDFDGQKEVLLGTYGQVRSSL